MAQPQYLSTDPNAGAPPPVEVTPLSSSEEAKFQSWAKANKIADVDAPQSKYDYRGYWKDVAAKGGDQRKTYEDGPHFPDTYKQHGHPTFSEESKYSKGKGDGGTWNGETYVPAPYIPPADNARMGPAPDTRPVTLGDLKEDPIAAIQRIGTILKRDASNPKTWITLAAMYLGPKALPYAVEAVKSGVSRAGRISVSPSVALNEFSLNQPQRMLKAVSIKEAPVESRVQGFERYMPNASAPAQAGSAIAPQPAATSPVETVSGGIRPPVDPPPASMPPGSGRNAYPDQKALNAEALARRRAEYQARAAASAPVGAPPTPVVAKPTLSAAEAKAYLQMRVLGKTDAQARQVIEASRALNDSLGLKTPTKAETRFPKGMRGKYQPPSE